MDSEDKRKKLREKSRLYAVLMDNYDASKTVDEVVQDLRTDSKPGAKSEIVVQTAFEELLEGLDSIYKEQIKIR